MNIRQFLEPSTVLADLCGRNKHDVLAELCEPVSRLHPALRQERLLATLLEREGLSSTGLEGGVAVPHGKLPGLPAIVGAFGRSLAGVEFDSLDGKPAHLLFVLFAPEAAGGEHLRVLARVSRILKSADFRDRLLAARDAAEIHRLITGEDDRLSAPSG